MLGHAIAVGAASSDVDERWVGGLSAGQKKTQRPAQTVSKKCFKRHQKNPTKQHIELLLRLPIQGKEKMCFYWYIVWKEIFATVDLALRIPALSCSLSHLLQEQPSGMEIIKLLTSQDQWVLK